MAERLARAMEEVGPNISLMREVEARLREPGMAERGARAMEEIHANVWPVRRQQ